MNDDALLAQKFAAVLPQLNERQRRLLLAAEARVLGYGGISRVARASGVSRATIQKAVREGPAGADVARASGGRWAQEDARPRSDRADRS